MRKFKELRAAQFEEINTLLDDSGWGMYELKEWGIYSLMGMENTSTMNTISALGLKGEEKNEIISKMIKNIEKLHKVYKILKPD
jgi:hypothetical protein